MEDYELAGKLSARLKTLQGVGDELGAEILDWRALGMAEWLCDRAEKVQRFRYPKVKGTCRSLAFFKKRRYVIQAQTASGKTHRLVAHHRQPGLRGEEDSAGGDHRAQPRADDSDGHAGALFSGNVNVGVPGASDNMFNYKGPQGVKTVGVFEEDHETREGFADVAEIVVGVLDALARMKRAGFLEVDL